MHTSTSAMAMLAAEWDRPLTPPPNLLSLPEPARTSMPRFGLLLVGLVILCLIPRTLMAWKTDIMCRDGVFFIRLASALEQGQVEQALAPWGINTYPFVLAAFHRAGISWELAGKLWGVGMATLTVLPLFGWIRRQFDPRLAMTACLLYAVHPKFIEYSPELIRDQTFWFLAMLSVYLTWRAVSEVRLPYFVGAGIALALAIHTRFEGWFLLVPMVLWSCYRCAALRERAWRPLLGLATCVAMYPTLLGLVHTTWLRDHPQQSWGDFRRLQYVHGWLIGSPGLPQAALQASSAVEPLERSLSPTDVVLTPPTTTTPSFSYLAWKYLDTLRRSLDALFGLLMFVGWWIWRRVWIRSDYQPLFYASLLVLAGTWIHLAYAHQGSSRHPLLVTLLASPFAAAGLLWLTNFLGSWMRAPSFRRQITAYSACVLVIGIAGWTDALASQDIGRHREAALGQWLRDQYGPQQHIATLGSLALMVHYGDGLSQEVNAATMDTMIEPLKKGHVDVMVLQRKRFGPRAIELLSTSAASLGWEFLDTQRLPVICHSEFLVLHPLREPTNSNASRLIPRSR